MDERKIRTYQTIADSGGGDSALIHSIFISSICL